MPTGDNKVIINLTTELKIHMDKHKGNLERSFYLALDYLRNHKDELVNEWGQAVYDEHVQRYSVSAVELRNRSVQRKKECLEQKRRELELREKELAIKTGFLNAETQAMNDKHEATKKANEPLEIKKLRREIADWEEGFARNPKFKENPEVVAKFEGMKAKLKEYEQIPIQNAPRP